MRACITAGLALLLMLLGLAARAEPLTSVAVMHIKPKLGVDPERCDLFNEVLENEIRSRGHDVIGESDIDTLLGLQELKDQLDCVDTACLAELGGALGVEELVHGSLAKMGDSLIATVKRTSQKRARVLKAATRRINPEVEEDFLQAVASIAHELYGGASKSLILSSPGPAAQAFSQPVWKRWWFWTGTVAVVGSVVAIAAATAGRSEEQPAARDRVVFYLEY